MKAYLIGGAIILWTISIWYSFDAGKDVQKGVEAQARQDAVAEQVEKVKIIYKEKIKIEVKYRDKIKRIYIAKDPTGCLDTKLGDVGLLPSTPTN